MTRPGRGLRAERVVTTHNSARERDHATPAWRDVRHTPVNDTRY